MHNKRLCTKYPFSVGAHCILQTIMYVLFKQHSWKRNIHVCFAICLDSLFLIAWWYKIMFLYKKKLFLMSSNFSMFIKLELGPKFYSNSAYLPVLKLEQKNSWKIVIFIYFSEFFLFFLVYTKSHALRPPFLSVFSSYFGIRSQSKKDEILSCWFIIV